MMNELETFLSKHNATDDMRTRIADADITSLRDAYDRAAPDDLIWIITRPRVMTQRDCVRFVLRCVESVETRLNDARSQAVIPLLRRMVDDAASVSEDEIRAVADTAYDAIDDSSSIGDYWASKTAFFAATAAAVYSVAAADDARYEQAAWIRQHIPFANIDSGHETGEED